MHTWQKYLAEVFGTMVLVGLGTMAIIAATVTNTPVQAAIPLGFGFALLAALYAVGEVSGGHFNPAVSLGAFIDRRIGFGDLVGYWIAQFAGAIFGSWIVSVIVSRVAVATTYTAPSDLVDTGTSQLFFGEVVFTAIFVVVILTVTQSVLSKQAFVAISLTLAAIHFAGVPLTGASVNPVRSFAPAVLGDFEGLDISRDDLWVYMTAPLVGAIVGWLLYRIIVKGDLDLRDHAKAVGRQLGPDDDQSQAG